MKHEFWGNCWNATEKEEFYDVMSRKIEQPVF